MFSNAENHLDIAQRNITANKVIPNVKVTYVAQFRWISGNMVTRHRIGILTVRFGAREPEETNNIFGMK